MSSSQTIAKLLDDAERDNASKAKRESSPAADPRPGKKPKDEFASGEDHVMIDDDYVPPKLSSKERQNRRAQLSSKGTKNEIIANSGNVDRYSSEREENDERRNRRSRDIDDESKEMSDKSANGSVRDRRRSRSPERSGVRSRDRSRDRYRDVRDVRDRDRDGGRYFSRGGDYYSGGGRPSAHSDDQYRPRSPRRDRSPLRSRGYRGGGGRRRSPPSGHAKTPEPTDDERDKRTVFVQQLAARLRTRELKEFFEQVGPVVEAQIVKDRVSQRSKGVGYVEFKNIESVEKALGLTGHKLKGLPIITSLTESEKNRQARNTEGTATQSNGIPFHRLYVGNIHFSITEDDLRNVFEPFGELEFVQLQKDETGRSKGYGFVQFVDAAQAKEALEKMNGFELAGRPIRVGLGSDKFTTESTQSLMQRFGSHNEQGSTFSGMGGRGAHAGGTANFDRASGRDQDKTGGASALDDTDVSGVNFSNYSRDSLMRKLARTEEAEPKVAPKVPQQSKTVVEEAAPSRCILIKHMFDANEETEPNWQEELKSDVKDECEKNYGIVVHIGLSLENNDGEVYVKFDRVEGGTNAIRGLNGRYFGGHIISAQYLVEAVYNINFPKAVNL